MLITRVPSRTSLSTVSVDPIRVDSEVVAVVLLSPLFWKRYSEISIDGQYCDDMVEIGTWVVRVVGSEWDSCRVDVSTAVKVCVGVGGTTLPVDVCANVTGASTVVVWEIVGADVLEGGENTLGEEVVGMEGVDV